MKPRLMTDRKLSLTKRFTGVQLKMGMLDRYKKKGGFLQLVNLIETSTKDKQEKFLSLIAIESAVWAEAVETKCLTLEKVLAWNTAYVAEVLPRLPHMQVAMIVGGIPARAPEILAILPYGDRKKVEDIVATKKITPAEFQLGCSKLFEEIRKMTNEGLLKFENFDPSLAIPDKIEDLLGQSEFQKSLKAAPSAPVKPADPAPSPKPVTVQAVFGPMKPAEIAGLSDLAIAKKKLVQFNEEYQKLMTENQALKLQVQKLTAKNAA